MILLIDKYRGGICGHNRESWVHVIWLTQQLEWLDWDGKGRGIVLIGKMKRSQ